MHSRRSRSNQEPRRSPKEVAVGVGSASACTRATCWGAPCRQAATVRERCMAHEESAGSDTVGEAAVLTCRALASTGTCHILHISKTSTMVDAGRGHNLGTLLFLPLSPNGALRAQQGHMLVHCRLQRVYLVLTDSNFIQCHSQQHSSGASQSMAFTGGRCALLPRFPAHRQACSSPGPDHQYSAVLGSSVCWPCCPGMCSCGGKKELQNCTQGHWLCM